MAAPQVTLQSITGVDVELRIAGAGSRSYAFVIDWHIRLHAGVGVAAWSAPSLYFGALAFLNASDPGWHDGYVLWVWLPTGFIYFFYHPMLEIAHARPHAGQAHGGRAHGHAQGRHSRRGRAAVAECVSPARLACRSCIWSVWPRSCFTEQHVRIGDHRRRHAA